MSENDDLAWRFDALDARGGMAFLSHRPADLEADGMSPDVDLPGVFVGPPGFLPESIASRALGFAATRGAFQYGLFHQGQEVGFASLGDAVEFVRRCFLRGGGADGADGTGGQSPPPLPPPDDEPGFGESERFFDAIFQDERRPLSMRLLKGVKVFAENVRNTSMSRVIEADASLSWPMALQTEDALPDFAGTSDIELIGTGAGVVLIELLRRCGRWDDKLGFVSWCEAAWRFEQTAAALGLWSRRPHRRAGPWPRRFLPTLLNSIPYAYLERTAENLDLDLDWFRNSAYAPGDAVSIIRWLLARERWMLIEPYGFPEDPGIRDRRPAGAMEDLGLWPIPQALRRITNGVDPERAGVRELLTAFIGSPSELLDQVDERWRMRLLSVVLFAAARLVPVGSPIPITTEIEAKRKDVSAPNGDGFLGAMHTQKVIAWLAQQLPRRAFPPEIEQMIAVTASLSYGKPPASPRTTPGGATEEGSGTAFASA